MIGLHRFRAGLQRFAADTTGTPLVEFALVCPILLATYLGSFVALDATSCTRKVSIAAGQITDISSRYLALTTSDVDAILASTTQILAPYPAANAKVRLTQVQICAAGYNGNAGTVARVVWSRATSNETALTADTTGGGTLPAISPTPVPAASIVTLPANMLAAISPLRPASGCSTGAFFIFGEVRYAYTPPINMFNVGSSSGFNFYDYAYMSPRGSTSISLS